MRILHLEDDGPLREILAAALRAVEPTCELHQFIESDNAVQYATNHSQAIDLFILDIRVPGSMDGLEVARRVRAMNCPGTIVLTSAYRAPDPQLVKELNCEWFPKPWHIYETITKLVALAQKKILPAKNDVALPETPVASSVAPSNVPVSSPVAQPSSEPKPDSPQQMTTPTDVPSSTPQPAQDPKITPPTPTVQPSHTVSLEPDQKTPPPPDAGVQPPTVPSSDSDQTKEKE